MLWEVINIRNLKNVLWEMLKMWPLKKVWGNDKNGDFEKYIVEKL
jgi:hypothetical protein